MVDEDEKDQTVHLEKRDYVAIVMASLQTTLLPFLVVIAVLAFLLLIFRR